MWSTDALWSPLNGTNKSNPPSLSFSLHCFKSCCIEISPNKHQITNKTYRKEHFDLCRFQISSSPRPPLVPDLCRSLTKCHRTGEHPPFALGAEHLSLHLEHSTPYPWRGYWKQKSVSLASILWTATLTHNRATSKPSNTESNTRSSKQMHTSMKLKSSSSWNRCGAFFTPLSRWIIGIISLFV